jgi:16S rRNA (cytidine1402-2'-O)-methyltransferase
MYEEVYRGSVQQAIDYFTKYPARGEYTLVVSGMTGSKEKWSEKELMDVLGQEMQTDAPLSQIARDVGQQSGWPRRQVYQLLTQLQEKE